MSCRLCGAPLLWGVTVKRHRMPLDPEPSPEGNVRLEPHEYRPEPWAVVLSGDELTRARAEGEPLFVSHFATCPHAKRHRRRRRK